MREETGLTVNIGEPIYVGEWRPVIKGVPNQRIGIFLVCTAPPAGVTLSREHDSFEWIDPADYGAFDIMDPEDKVIEHYLHIR